MRGLFCYRGGCRTQRPVPHVLIIHLFFIPLSATNYLQKYTKFLTSQRFYRKNLKNLRGMDKNKAHEITRKV